MSQPQEEHVTWKSDSLDCALLSSDPAGWVLAQKTVLGEAYWVLAFSLDGVTWGKVENDMLAHSGQIFSQVSPGLDVDRLREIYAFSETGQAHAWRLDDGWHAVWMEDVANPDGDSFTEDYYLWGNRLEDYQSGFALLSEGAQGIVHAVPLPQQPAMKSDYSGGPKLVVRHYLGRGEAGAARIAATRLVKVTG